MVKNLYILKTANEALMSQSPSLTRSLHCFDHVICGFALAKMDVSKKTRNFFEKCKNVLNGGWGEFVTFVTIVTCNIKHHPHMQNALSTYGLL